MKKILYFGPEGSYTQKAMNKAQKILPLGDYISEPCLYISDIIDEVNNNKDFIGIIPIENSIEGIVRETLDYLVKAQDDIKIFQEIIIPINHCLSNKTGDITKVKKIISHPQALAQCNGYIRELRKKLNCNIETLSAKSTSQAVKSLNEFDENYAAISSEETALLYGQKILDKNINDQKDNKTRFICIGHNNPPFTNNDRTSIAFTTINKAGALVDVLSILKEFHLNMSYIESRPSKKTLGEYMFFIDIDGHIENDNVKKAYEQMKRFTTYDRFLGSYPKFPEELIDD